MQKSYRVDTIGQWRFAMLVGETNEHLPAGPLTFQNFETRVRKHEESAGDTL